MNYCDQFYVSCSGRLILLSNLGYTFEDYRTCSDLDNRSVYLSPLLF